MELRRLILKTICQGGGGHISASLSIVETLAVLYYKVLRIDPAAPSEPDRDRFILSKGHACVALYAVLADLGFFGRRHLSTFGERGTILGGHPELGQVPGVEASTGALGHGLPIAVGMALAARLDARSYRTFVLMGDGECQEGTVWEAAMFAAQHRLDNLVAIIDNNELQAMDRLDNIVGVDPLVEKWRGFGWQVLEVDGHSPADLEAAFASVPLAGGKPSLVLARTTKGKGVSFMENEAIWHYRLPNEDEKAVICGELGMKPEDLEAR